MTITAKLVILRHGETTYNAERKMTGSASAPAVVVVPETPASPQIRAFMAEMDRLRPAQKG